MLRQDNVPFYLVVEPQEEADYRKHHPETSILALPFRDLGSVTPARNWIKDHSTAAGSTRHWQLDDNIRDVVRWYRGKRIPCDAGMALAIVEDFADRYENVAVAGLNYQMFGVNGKRVPPFRLNCHVYSCSLILNCLPNRWRLRYNEDTDFCLQVLADGWCTVLVNAFLAHKIGTMKMRGGNTDTLYQGDGRLKMARMLERAWPGIVETKRRWHRPQHVVAHQWTKFDTPLKRKPGLTIEDGPNEYGLVLRQVLPEIRSPRIKKLLDEQGNSE